MILFRPFSRLGFLTAALFSTFILLSAAEPWEEPLAQMPLGTNVTVLSRTNVATVLLNAFQSNTTVKAIVLLPGATDEFYFFRRAQVTVTNLAPTLLDAVRAITGQTSIRVRFRPPLLLLHTAEDPSEPLLRVENEAAAAHLRAKHFLPHVLSNDRDWDYWQPQLTKTLSSKVLGLPEILPPPRSRDSWHFFRHTFSAWHLNGWEALEALSLAGKTTVTIRRTKLIFTGDTRLGGSNPEK